MTAYDTVWIKLTNHRKCVLAKISASNAKRKNFFATRHFYKILIIKRQLTEQKCNNNVGIFVHIL